MIRRGTPGLDTAGGRAAATGSSEMLGASPAAWPRPAGAGRVDCASFPEISG